MSRKFFFKLSVGFLSTLMLLLSPGLPRAQAAPAVRGGGSLWVGGEFSRFSPDFGPAGHLHGIGAYADLNWNPRLGVEGAARFLRFHGYHGEYEDSYLIGPRVTIFPRGKVRPFAKFLMGEGGINFPYQIGTGSYFAFAPGGGIDYRLTRRIAVRGEYEYQFWPSAPGIAREPSNGMKPNGVSVGAAYRIF